MVSFPMTDEQFATASAQLRGKGIDLIGPSGTLSKEGITARYEHANGQLTVEILDKPFLLPLGLIESRMRAYFEQYMAGTAQP